MPKLKTVEDTDIYRNIYRDNIDKKQQQKTATFGQKWPYITHI